MELAGEKIMVNPFKRKKPKHGQLSGHYNKPDEYKPDDQN
jgi:hypothetical protein